MVIFGTIITGLLVVNGLTRGADDGLPLWVDEKGYRPIEILYCLPRIIAPFFLMYSLIGCRPFRTQLLICGMLYLFSFTVKALYWRFVYGISKSPIQCLYSKGIVLEICLWNKHF